VGMVATGASTGWVPQGSSRRALIGVLVIALLVCVIAGIATWRQGVDNSAREAARQGAAVGGGTGPAPGLAPFPELVAQTVKYEVTGSSSQVSLTYQTESGSTQRDAGTPWTYSLSNAGPGDFLYVSAQDGTGSDTATVTCAIYVNGTKVASNTAQGAFKIATCSGSL
jgi:hypothetical protein